MRRTIWLGLAVLPLMVAGGLVYAGWWRPQAPSAVTERFVCPLTGEELPCPLCCPLTDGNVDAACGEKAEGGCTRCDRPSSDGG